MWIVKKKKSSKKRKKVIVIIVSTLFRTRQTAILTSRQILKIIVYGLSINTEQDITAFFVKRNGRCLLSIGKEINLK